MTAFPQIVVGTYEEFVLGYNLKYEDEKKKKIAFHQTFATHSHQASVRCVATHESLMASSGADEYINIYDMVEMEVLTVINCHDSTVTCLEFTPDGSHLITANQNGDIIIFECTDWTLVKLWKEVHKPPSGVTSMSVHPSGSLLLTTGADNKLRFWNLVKGRQAYATNFSKKCSVANTLNFATWSKNGNFYSVFIGNKVEVYRVKTAAIVYKVKTKARITSSAFTKKNLLCLGMEDGSLEIHSIQHKCLLLAKEAHELRIKSLDSFTLNFLNKEKTKLKSYLVSVDSRGGIKLWLLKKKQLNCSLILKGETSCHCRITCLTLVASQDVKEEKEDLSGDVKASDPVEDIFVDEQNMSQNLERETKKTTENGCSKIHSKASKNKKAKKIKVDSVLALNKKRKNSEHYSEKEKSSKFKKKKLLDSNAVKG